MYSSTSIFQIIDFQFRVLHMSIPCTLSPDWALSPSSCYSSLQKAALHPRWVFALASLMALTHLLLKAILDLEGQAPCMEYLIKRVIDPGCELLSLKAHLEQVSWLLI